MHEIVGGLFMKTKKQFIIYLIVTFGLAWILQGISIYFASIGNTGLFQIIIAFSMFAPLIGAIVSKSNVSKIGWKPKFKGHVKNYLFSWFMPAVLGILGAVLFFIIFPGLFGTVEDGIIAAAGAEQGKALLDELAIQGISPWIFFAITIIETLTYAPAINAIFAAGEEAGWRGAMYPYLKEKFGTNKGRILGGTIWGVWHWPIIIFAGYEYGTEYFGFPWVGPLAFVIIAIVFGILCDYVYQKGESIWAPSIFHGAINAFAGVPTLLVTSEFAKYRILGPSSVGLISIIPMLVCAVIICIKAKKKA